MPNEAQGRRDVEVEQRLPGVGIRLGGGRDDLDPCVVDEHVDRSALALRFDERSLSCLRIDEIGSNDRHPATELLRQGLELLLAAGDERQLRSPLLELPREGLADPD